MHWPTLESLLSNNTLPYIDYALAQFMLKEVSQPSESLAAFICHLSLASRNGHLCIKIENEQIYPCPQDLWESPCEKLSILIIEGSNQIKSCSKVIQEGNRFYFEKYWSDENLFIKYFNALKDSKPALQSNLNFVQAHLNQLVLQKKLLQEQASVIANACENSLSLICGGPGTGKTYTAGYLINTFLESLPEPQKSQCEIALAAPTGKAASHLQSSLAKVVHQPLVSKTLHSLLGTTPYLTADLILVDESSMIDVKLMLRLFASIKPGARLILLGDPYQLPPVESGGLFSDLIAILKPLPLTHCQRIELKEIVEFAEAVKSGNQILNLSSEAITCHSLTENYKSDLHSIVHYATPFFDCAEGADDLQLIEKFNRFRILTPLRKGPFGVDAVNAHLHRALKKKTAPIMILSNDKRLGLFNGEVGLLVRQSLDHEEFKKGDYALFPSSAEPCRKIPAVLLPKFEYAYCLSVHKSQGSEFDHLLLLMPEGSEVFGREVLYTAITRARKKIEIFTKDFVLEKTIQKRAIRLSGIQDKLI